MRGKIAIIFHEKDRRDDWFKRYMIMEYVPIWRELGLETEVLFGVKQQSDADLAILHIDLSVVPEKYIEFASRFPRALNGTVRDIRKSTTSSIRLGPDDRYDGPVIVKSDLNTAGVPERRNLPFFPRTRLRIRKHLTRREDRIVGEGDYRAFESLKDVPRRLFADSRLVVERFIPEVEGEFFFVRTCIILGDRVTWNRLRSASPVIKAYTKIDYEPAEPRPEVLELARSLGFDYGKFDHVVHDGKATVLDCNKTIGRGTGYFDNSPRRQALRVYRAEGILKYFS